MRDASARALSKKGVQSMARPKKWIFALAVTAAIAGALGCTDASVGRVTTSSTAAGSGTATTIGGGPPSELEDSVGRPQLPEGLKGVVGVTVSGDAQYLWALTKDGVARLNNYAFGDLTAAGSMGNWLAYGTTKGRAATLYQIGNVEGKTNKRQIDIGEEGDTLDHLWMSPDEKWLLISLSHPVDVTSEASLFRLWLVDVSSCRPVELEEMAPLMRNKGITAVAWGPGDGTFCFSLARMGGSLGEESFLYRWEDRSVTELEGLATVWDVGPSGEVVGLELAPPIEPPLPEGQSELSAGTRPFALWSEGTISRLPLDQRLRRWSNAWFSPDGDTLVLEGQAQFEGSAWENALELLKRGQGGWRIAGLVHIHGEPGLAPAGVAFTCSPAGFWVQDQVSKEADAMPSGVWLGLLDVGTGRYRLKTRLPGADYSTAIGVASEAGLK